MAFFRCGCQGVFYNKAIKTTKASIASFVNKTGANLALKSLTCYINPTQSGSGKPYPAGGGKNKMPDVFTPLPATNTQLVDYGTDISFTGLYLSFVFSGQFSTLGGAFIQAKDSNNSTTVTFTFSNLRDENNNALSANTQYTNKLVHISHSSTIAVKKWTFFRNWNPSNDATITNFMLSIGNTAVDYAPYSNIRPITGVSSVNVVRCGVNTWSENWENGDLNNTTGETSPSNAYIRSKDYEIIKPSTQYCVSLSSTSVFYYDATKTFISRVLTSADNQAITTPSNARFFKIKRYSTTGYGNNISINYPSSVTGYHAYTGNTYLIDLDGTYYGTTLDVVSGKLRLIKQVLDKTHFPSMTVYFNSEAGIVMSFYLKLPDNYRANDTFINSNYFTPQTITSIHAYDCEVTSSSANRQKIYFSISNVDYPYMTAEEAKQFLIDNDVQFEFNLATPIEIDLTPTQINSLLGQNNIYHDANGDVEAEYYEIAIKEGGN